MRALPLVVLLGCAKASSGPTKVPDRIVVIDGLTDREFNTLKLSELETEPSPYPGCKWRRTDGDVVLTCPDRKDFVRFNCAATTATHPLRVMLDGHAFVLFCE